jgi:hypothetical protein
MADGGEIPGVRPDEDQCWYHPDLGYIIPASVIRRRPEFREALERLNVQRPQTPGEAPYRGDDH